jgi:hypothetical protein
MTYTGTYTGTYPATDTAVLQTRGRPGLGVRSPADRWSGP